MNFEESAFLIPSSQTYLQHQLNENLQKKARKLHDLNLACFGKI